MLFLTATVLLVTMLVAAPALAQAPKQTGEKVEKVLLLKVTDPSLAPLVPRIEARCGGEYFAFTVRPFHLVAWGRTEKGHLTFLQMPRTSIQVSHEERDVPMVQILYPEMKYVVWLRKEHAVDAGKCLPSPSPAMSATPASP